MGPKNMIRRKFAKPAPWMRPKVPASTARPVPRRAVLAGTFGLIHGAGFANFLRIMFFGPIALPLVSFNIGIELGQLVIILGALLLFAAADRIVSIRLPGRARRLRATAASVVVAAWALAIALERVPR